MDLSKAIEIVEEVKEIDDSMWQYNSVYEEALETLIEAAKKQEETFEWCTGCKEYDKEKHCCHRFSKVIRNTIEEYKAEQPKIQEDRTLIVTVPKGTDVGRVLVEEDGTQNGGLYYPDGLHVNPVCSTCDVGKKKSDHDLRRGDLEKAEGES